MNIAIILDSEHLTNAVQWGRQQSDEKRTVVDTTGQIDAEPLRRWLRDAYKHNTPGVFGSWREGYEINLCTGEVVGVTNGHGPFRVYYRKPYGQRKMSHAEQVEMAAMWQASHPDDDYGLAPRELSDLW